MLRRMELINIATCSMEWSEFARWFSDLRFSLRLRLYTLFLQWWCKVYH